MRDCTIMLIWRIWSLRSDLTHGKEAPPVTATIWSLRSDLTHGKEAPPVTATSDYLQSYMNSLNLCCRLSMEEILKGKMPMIRDPTVKVSIPRTHLHWSRPLTDQAALSVDGAFMQEDGSAAAGMILRRHDGSVIFAAYRCIFNCNDVLEAELHAIMQGMALALQHCSLPIVVQSNSSMALAAMTGDSLSRFVYGHLVAEIRLHMEAREFVPSKITREQNRVAHRLALYSRIESTTVVWLGRSPPCIEELVPLDCNPMHME
ncbi:hypothetical protein VPH35_068890 [Triticum aestivum]